MPSKLVANSTPDRDLASLLSYAAAANRRDEALTADGKVQPEWFDLFESIHRNGPEGVSAWRQGAARVSRERGLAYRPGSIDESPEEGWSLDPIPWVVSPERWTELEAGITQRTRLFSAFLADLYGARRMLKERLFPAEILLNNRGFLRALHNLPPGGPVIGLGLSAFDVARGSGGQTFVVNDRFDAPFGLGLALENRSVVNKVLPRLFGRCGVRRIGQFFIDWFDHLGRCAPSDSVAPQVVILDPSEQGEDSEVGFLANYCGISRVHPSDLTVRDGRVWIKALRGLVPVDVIWKMMAGRDMDSLESENSHARGIAGVFESIRGGGVAVASHPGSEVLQSPGFYPYLPQLCRTLLGEELTIPPVATWWCGEPKALSHVLANIQSMVIKPAGHHHDFRTKYGSRLSGTELEELRRQITAEPTRYVGQEELAISTIPTSRSDGVVPRGGVLRVFAFPDHADAVHVMPGGLARVSTADGVVISTRDCGESKDVWVRSPSEEKPFSIASALTHTQLITADIVPSRTGENLYWTGRYAERTDVISRFAARIVDGRMKGFARDYGFAESHEQLLVKALTSIFNCEELLKDKLDADARLELLLLDKTCPVGVSYNLDRFYNASQTAREEWSPASTLAISSCYESWQVASSKLDQIADFGFKLENLQLNLAAFLGLNLDSMTRDEGWALLDAGRRLERTSTVCRLLRFLLRADLEEDMRTLFSESILYLLDSVRTFQSRFHAVPSALLTVRLLLGEMDYPRSVAHLMERLKQVLKRLPDPGHRDHPGDLIDPWLDNLKGFVQDLEAERLDSGAMIEFLDEMHEFLLQLSDAITVSYFSHARENV
jgi:uncharacterized circularly permuted ATP-grasp superfamily protein/uncharacterized alpha-E superfamily protein